MILLALSVVLFGMIHIAPAVTRWHEWLSSRLGAAYRPAHGIALLALFGFCIWSFRIAETPGDLAVLSWGRHANFLLTWLAFLCLGVFLFRGSWRPALRFPMALAVILWGTGHLLANIESRAFVFFGGMVVIAVVHAVLRNREPQAVPVIRDGHNLLSILFGTAIYGIMTQLHEAVIGVPVFSLAQ